MQVITIAQNKGGAGKTTTAKLVATGLAKRGYRTLAIDLDSQCNLSSRFVQMDISMSDMKGKIPPLHPEEVELREESPDWSGRSSSADIFLAREIYPYPTPVENLELIPGNGDELPQVGLVTANEVVKKIHEQLKLFVNSEGLREAYDIVIIDTDPSKSPLPVSAIRAATHLIIPTDVDPMGLEGLHGMLSMWMAENRRRPAGEAVELIGILPNKIRNNVASQNASLAALRESNATRDLMFPGQLSARSAFSDSDHEAIRFTSVLDLPPSNKARKEAEAMLDHVARRLEVGRHV